MNEKNTKSKNIFSENVFREMRALHGKMWAECFITIFTGFIFFDVVETRIRS